MKNIIEINDITALELDVYARTSEVQLLRYNEPNPGLFIAESPKEISLRVIRKSRYTQQNMKHLSK